MEGVRKGFISLEIGYLPTEQLTKLALYWYVLLPFLPAKFKLQLTIIWAIDAHLQLTRDSGNGGDITHLVLLSESSMHSAESSLSERFEAFPAFYNTFVSYFLFGKKYFLLLNF